MWGELELGGEGERGREEVRMGRGKERKGINIRVIGRGKDGEWGVGDIEVRGREGGREGCVG